MKIAVAQMRCGVDVDANKALATELATQAAKQGAGLIVYPEMSILEFFPRNPHNYEYFDLAEPIPGSTSAWFQDLARKTNIHIVYNHFEFAPEHVYFDTAVLVARGGEIVGTQRMMHIAEEPGYNERFYYTPGWDSYKVFELDGWRFGIATCYDRHFPEVFRSLILKGAEVALIPTAVAASEPFAEVYELEARAAAVTHGLYIAMANRVGTEAPLEMMGSSMIVDPMSKVIAKASANEPAIALAELDKKTIRKARMYFPFLKDRRPETYGALVEHNSRGVDE